MDWRKAAAWTAGIAGLLVAAGAIAFHVMVDPQRIKAAALEHARSAWQRELLLEDVSLTLFPAPAFEAARVSFSNPPWCRDPHLLQADRVRADLELLPLLWGEVRVKSLELDGVRAKLEERDDGTASWRLAERPASRGAGEGQLRVGEVRLRNVTIHHRAGRDASEPWHVEEALLDMEPGLRDARIDAKVSRHGQPLEIHARLADLSKAGAEGAASEGKVELRWAKTSVAAEGMLPLDRGLRGTRARVHARSDSLQDVFAFFGIERKPTAPLDMRFEAREADGRLQLSALSARLGALQVSGEAQVAIADGKPVIAARLSADRLDWLRTLVDAGGEVKPKRQNQEIFHEDPVAWGAVRALGALDGSTVDLKVASLRLGNGLELRDVGTRIALGEGRVAIGPFSAALLGGRAKGELRFDAERKSIHAKLDGDNLQLEQWFRQRGSKVPFSGGAMRVEAALTLQGDTYRDLAASLTGPVRLRMGKGSWTACCSVRCSSGSRSGCGWDRGCCAGCPGGGCSGSR
jgi:hypothetical protein